MFERRAEEFPLTNRSDTGNDNDDSGVQRFLPVESKEVGTIVRYKRIVLLADGGHKLPVFCTAKAEIVDMIGYVTCSMRQFNQRCV